MGYVNLIANKHARYLRSALLFQDHERNKEFLINLFDNLERRFVPDGEDKDVAIDTGGIAHTELGVLVLAIGVENVNVVVHAVNNRLPHVLVLKGEHVVRLESVLGDADRERRLAHAAGS